MANYRERLKALGNTQAAERPTPTVHATVTAIRPRSDLHPYAASAVAQELARLDALPRPWVDGASYWDTTTFEVACNLIEIANSPWSGYSHGDADRDLRAHAPRDNAWGDRQVDKCWTSAQARIGGESRPQPSESAVVPIVTVLGDTAPPDEEPARGVIVRNLADVAPRKPTWLWDSRIPAGELTLLAGAEGSGKSTITADLAARVTRGQLDGHYKGTPQGVLFVGVEDSIEETLVPRLIAAGADMTRVATIDHAFDHETGLPVMLTLPRDLLAVVEAAQAHDVAMVVLDPIGSRLGSLDTHKDSEVRAALEPLVAVFRNAGIATLGLIHVNKDREATGTTDALMGSRAFPAVARAVHLVTRDDNERFMSMIKSNLGVEMPDLLFDTIAEGDSSKIQWKGERPRMGDMERADCRAWLEAYVSGSGGQAMLSDIRIAARPEGWSDGQLRRARASLRLVTSRTHDYPSKTVWEFPAVSVLPGGHD